jgi:CRP-like cAMP-binding protein
MLSPLYGSFLFKGLDRNRVDEILKDNPPQLLSYVRSDIIDLSLPENSRLGFVILGECEVVRIHPDGARTRLNRLVPCDSFGILSVLSEDERTTEIYMSKNTTVAYFNRDQIMSFVNNYSQISMNLIEFLANRLNFLNKKIETFSGTRVENRLASYLLHESERCSCLSFPLNVKKCSEAINSGRASVYRAIDALSADGLINLADKKITILDQKGLERIAK